MAKWNGRFRKKYFYNYRTNEVRTLLKEQLSKTKKKQNINININWKKVILISIIAGVGIYFIIVLYGLVKKPTNIFMVENRNT